MAKQISVKVPAHHNIYTKKRDRELRIDFCIPEDGTNEDTGLLILVPGFGANIDSKVYAKMRNLFSDKYNLVTIQCEFFGSAYMQGAKSYNFKDPQILHEIFSVDEMKEIVKKPSSLVEMLILKEITIPMVENLNESIDEFNDMGYMQAIDILTSIELVKKYLSEKNIVFNNDRVIGYGQSHGAFLLLLCNRIYPVFSFIIDNCAWIEPAYLNSTRVLYNKLGKANLEIEFNYLAREIVRKREVLNLHLLYEAFDNDTQIVSFQGDNDNLVDHYEKQNIINKISNSDFYLITEKDIDNIKFKSNRHGLDADFFELFSYAIQLERPVTNKNMKKKYTIILNTVNIHVDYTANLPNININF